MSEVTPPSPTPPSDTGSSHVAVPEPSLALNEDSGSQALSETLQSGFQIIRVIMIGLVVLFFCSGVFEIQENQLGVILRFGRPVGTGSEQLLKAGWHWAWPYPIDEVVKIPIGQVHTVISSSGWYATTPEQEAQNAEPQPRGSLSPEADGYTLTGDGNIIHVRATVKYRISDPLRYTFGFTNVTAVLTNVINDAIFYASARTNAAAALYTNKVGFRDLVLDRVQKRLEDLQLGITLQPSDVETKPPPDVRVAFEAVNAAEQERSKTVSDARGYHDEVTRKAVGEANAIVSGGITSSNRVVLSLTADARAFTEQLPYYLENRHLFEQRLLTATMEKVLTNSTAKFTFPEHVDELRLQLNTGPEKHEAKEQP